MTENNFCHRCGKRLTCITDIHTCTPPSKEPIARTGSVRREGKQMTLRIETARILKHMLIDDRPKTVAELAEELDLTHTNMHKRTKQMFDQKLIRREARYQPAKVGRTTVWCMWVTVFGKEQLKDYEHKKLLRPRKSQAKPKVQVRLEPVRLRNSIFDMY